QMLRLAESRTVNDVQETNAIGLGLDPSNNAVVDLTHPAAWRSTLQVLPLAGGDMTGEIASKFSAGVSYIQGCAGNGTGLYMKKASTSSSTWNPAMTVQPKGQGGWSMGNYDGEELRFTYGTKANIDSNTNTTAHTMALYDSLLTVTNNVRLVHKSNYAAISFQGAKRTGDVIRFYGSTANADGDEIVIGNGGQVIVGSGESAVNLHTALAADVGTEQTYIISDNSIFLCTKANTIGNRVKWQFAANNYPTVYADCGAENGVVIGTSSNNGVTANTTIGQYYMRDKNGYWTLCLGNRTNASDNSIYGYIGVRNQKTDGTDVTNYIQAIVDKDGNRKYNVSDAGQFRSAISTHSRYTQLYNNTSGSNAAITLSATAANYTWLRIYFYGKSTASGSATKYDSVDVYSPNGKIVQLSCSGQGKSGDTAVIFFTKFVTISGTSVANTSYCSASIDTGGTTCAKNNEIYITRVDGWTN
ncbi:MAG: hypothetical protein IJF97_09765, partial [Eggerthellaceae bacterium]|nr:hypothetical protein [Eggerthellaceae bacterium]